MINIAAVWQGDRFGREYPERLRSGVLRHTPMAGGARFLLLTDRDDAPDGWEVFRTDTARLPGWWAKMMLLCPMVRRHTKTVFLDLDTIVLGDISPLMAVDAPLAICRNFHRREGRTTECGYGSAVMVLDEEFGSQEWLTFYTQRDHFMRKAGGLGDQRVIEWLCPDAAILQDMMPARFFCHKTEFTEQEPACSLAVFAGDHKPHTSSLGWVRRCWV